MSTTPDTNPTPEHYKKHCPKCSLVLDPYRIGVIYALNPMADHIVKKGLCAGDRGHKELRTDLQDIIDTATRWKQMLDEDDKVKMDALYKTARLETPFADDSNVAQMELHQFKNGDRVRIKKQYRGKGTVCVVDGFGMDERGRLLIKYPAGSKVLVPVKKLERVPKSK